MNGHGWRRIAGAVRYWVGVVDAGAHEGLHLANIGGTRRILPVRMRNACGTPGGRVAFPARPTGQRHMIDSTLAPRIAAQQPPHRQRGPDEGAAGAQCGDAIAAAARVVPAARRGVTGDEPLVEADRRDQHQRRQGGPGRDGSGRRGPAAVGAAQSVRIRSSDVLEQRGRRTDRAPAVPGTLRRGEAGPQIGGEFGAGRGRGRRQRTDDDVGAGRQPAEVVAHQGSQAARHPVTDHGVTHLRGDDEASARRILPRAAEDMDNETTGTGPAPGADHRCELGCASEATADG